MLLLLRFEESESYSTRRAYGKSEVRPGLILRETLNGAHLVYRFRIDFTQAVHLDAVAVSGLGDYSSGGSNAVLRILDANRNVVAVLSTTRQPCCTQGSYLLTPSNISGQTFFVDEFDYSTNGRYRDHIALSYRPQ